jgi:hypothetical protein
MTEPVVTVERRCRIDEVFAGPFIDLIALAPRNPVVRGLILAQTRRMPGPDCETFEQVKDWVETTCERKARRPDQPVVQAEEGISITVEFSETEYGRANYSVQRSGNDEFEINADELLDMVREAIDEEAGVDGVIEKIGNLIDSDAWSRCDPGMEDYGDYDYDQHESSDTDNSATEFSKTILRDRLLAFLRNRHPELLEELT